MNNGSCIIDAIIGEANAAAESNIAAAAARAEEITSTARAKIAVDINNFNIKKTSIIEEIVNRKKMVANIDAKKQNLNNKMHIIDEVFAGAPEAIHSDKRYPEFLKKLIEDNAEDGDTVIICKTDSKTVNKAFIDSLKQTKGININLSKEFGDFVGGVIISNNNYDKNLTLESIVKQLRGDMEMEMATVLFGK